MPSVFDIAVKIATPLSLAGLLGAAYFLILEQILRRRGSVKLVRYGLTLLFILCLVAMSFGFAGFILRARAQTSASIASHKPCDGEWHVDIDFSKLNNDTETKFVGNGEALISWKASDDGYDAVIWVTITRRIDPTSLLLTSVTRSSILADSDGRPNTQTMPLEYLAQFGVPPYDKPPIGQHIEYTNVRFEWSADQKRVVKITARYHSERTDAEIRFHRK